MTQNSLFFWLVVSLLALAIVLPVQAQEIPFNTSIGGDRNLGDLYTWHVNNASGRANVSYFYQVYDYRIIGENYTYHSPAWGQWFVQYAQLGKKYLAVWVRGWTKGTTWYGYGQERFPLWIWDNTTVYPEPVHMQDMNTSFRSMKQRPAVISEVQNRTPIDKRGWLTRERYGWKDEIEYDRIEPGLSNAFEGYILYQIPRAAQPEDIRVIGWFGYWGTAIWHLTNVTINQDSIERKISIDRNLFDLQREMGLRISDSPDNRREG